MDIHIAKTFEDAEVIADLAASIWIEHYASILGVEQVTYMLQTLQSKSAIWRSIQSGQVYWLVCDQKLPIGYASYSLSEDVFFLSKLYLNQLSRGKGLGRQLFKQMIDKAKDENKSSIMLTVNKYNTPSIAAYKKMGFKTINETVTDIGHGFVMDDYVMTYNIL